MKKNFFGMEGGLLKYKISLAYIYEKKYETFYEC